MGIREKLGNWLTSGGNECTECQELDDLAVELEKARAEIIALQQEKTAMGVHRAELQGKIKALESEKAALEVQKTELENQLTKMRPLSSISEVRAQTRQECLNEFRRAQIYPGIREFIGPLFTKFMQERCEWLSTKDEPICDEEGVSYRYYLPVRTPELRFKLTKAISFISLDQAAEALNPVELPIMASALGLERMNPRFLPCGKLRALADDEQNPENPPCTYCEMTLGHPQDLTFAVFIPKQKGETNQMEEVEQKVAELAQYCKGNKKMLCQLIFVGTKEIIFIVDAETYMDGHLRDGIASGRYLAATCTPDIVLKDLRQQCTDQWREGKPGLIIAQ